MKSRRHTVRLIATVMGAIIAFVVLGNLWLLTALRTEQPEPRAVPRPSGTALPASGWLTLLEKTPYAYTMPLPTPNQSAIDGTYARINQSWPQWWSCRRCADYRPAGGIWRLQFDRGVMRIYYEVTGWYSVASLTMAGDRLRIFNDPYCPKEVGEYTWVRADGQLRLTAIADTCSFGLRSQNLGADSWFACPSPVPSGCEETVPLTPADVPGEVPVTVRIHPGDSRFFTKPPDLIAYANSADHAPPEGIAIAYHRESIAYGLHRVLWWNGDWIEVTTKRTFASVGVQFMGAPQIGWARVLFDGVEVWRGQTSALGAKYGQHGGYIEISGFPPGEHMLRVESLGFDYRPVTVLGFGFSLEGEVESEQP